MLRKDPFVTGEFYHLYNRGVDKREIFKSKSDFERFMMLLYVANNEDSLKFDNLINILHKGYKEIMCLDRGEQLISIGAWCLMPNHFHLLVKQEVDGGITKFMRKLGVGYSMFFNIKYKRQGALFGGPFKSKFIDDDDIYLRYLFAYIHLNPLDIEFKDWNKEIKFDDQNMKKFLISYRYSSYQDYCGLDRVETGILNKEAFPDYFKTNDSFDHFINLFLTSENSSR